MLSKLKKLGVENDHDLLRHYPFRYMDLKDYQQGVVVSSKNIYTRSGKTLQKIIIKTESGNKEMTWFNQPYLVQTLKPGVSISIAGNEYEINGPLIHTGRLVPVYPETAGVSSKMLRRRIFNLLKKPIDDWLPEEIKKEFHLIDLNTAIHQIHFPQNEAESASARRRLAFDEMLEAQLIAKAKKLAWKKQGASQELNPHKKELAGLIDSLPFKLTSSQNQAMKEIIDDLGEPESMNRLLQGEVGSGKTVVAALAMYISYLNGLQSVMMAPTEILANQHYQTLKTIFANTSVKIGLVTKSVKEEGDILVGTQALLNKKFVNLGLLVIDEQHRFGVKQRSQLLELKPTPQLLSMTATPIPRTLALTIYAHLEISTIDSLPGKQIVKTWLVPQEKRLKAYDWIKEQIKKNDSQVFIVCPLINPSEKESMQDIKDITTEFERLKDIFAEFKLGLIHGRLKANEKETVITDFSQNKIDILVATPVIEVGIDIPQASIILIENAERFGLAQLHQLRGRVGRRGQTAYCLMFSSKTDSQRLKILETTTSGIKLAEYDLKLRGEGKIFGIDQHGFSQFKLADLSDIDLIKATKKAADSLDLKNLPNLSRIATVTPN